MTRSPLTATLLALIPLVALAFPLAKVLKPDPVIQVEPAEPTRAQKLLSAHVLIRSAHPFQKVTINDTIFAQGETEKTLNFDPSKPIEVLVKWPEGTPDSAALIELTVDGYEIKSQTFWGTEVAVGDLNFNWEVEQ